MEERIDVLRGQLVQASVAAPRVVDDEDVERPERRARSRDDAFRGVGLGEIGLEVGCEIVRAPRLRLVVRRPAVGEDARAVRAQSFGDREADPGTARDAGDERGGQVVSTPTTSRTASEEACSACCSSSESSSSMICSIPFGPSLQGTPM